MMHSKESAIAALSQVLHKELTGINQYFIHAKMCKKWGYTKLADTMLAESIEEMRHADAIIERILFLDGHPDLSASDKMQIGKTVREQLENDAQLELDALDVLRSAIQRCSEAQDSMSQALLEGILTDEEEHLRWLKAQLHQIQEGSYETWLMQQIA